MKKLIYSICILSLIFNACNNEPSGQTADQNPAALGFNLEASDSEAIQIADEVMATMGGRSAWESTRFIQWTFFGRRNLTWDKKEQLCRIEIPGDSLTILVNLKENSGKVKKGKRIYTHPDSLTKYVQRGKEIWINDSYWLVMPYKLKDSGVTLKYIGTDTTATGEMADVLELTFENVGVTPENKYHVYVDKEKRLITQWDFYTKYADTTARFSTPWADYVQKGSIMLSGNRGRSSLTNIEVLESVDPKVFSEL